MLGLQKERDAREFADAAVVTWQDVSAALAPIIGAGGMAALYERCVSMARIDYPWLTNVSEAGAPCDFATYGRQLSRQTSSDAIAANDFLLHYLSQLLGNLIGASLTRRLLQPVWAKHGLTLQDTTRP